MNCLAATPLLSILFIPLAAAVIPDGRIIDRVPCALPEYGNVSGLDGYATPGEYTEAIADTRFVCEKLRYASDGLPVVALLYRSADAAGKRMPVVVFNRGSYTVKDQAPLSIAMFRRLGIEGFLVIAPMYRGSEGAPGHDEFGGADLHDLMNVSKVLEQIESADRGNVFLYGESRGAVMSLMALRDGFPAKAAATVGAFTDLGDFLAADMRAAGIVKVVWPDWDARKAEILESRSALRFTERLKTPLLIMQGGADPQVNPTHSLKLASRLQELGRPYGLIVFEGDGHRLSKNRIERDRQAAQWFRRHLK